MQLTILLIAVLALAVIGLYFGRRRALRAAGTNLGKLHSMPSYHGWYVALWCGIPSGIVLIVWLIIEAPILEALLLSYLGPTVAEQSEAMIGLLLNDVRNLASGDVVSREIDPAMQAAADRYASMKSTAQAAVLAIGVALGGAGFGWAWRRISPGLRARNKVERVVNIVLILSSCVAIVTTIGIVLSVLFESIRFFSIIPFWDFLFGLKWSPQTAIRADQVGSTGAFGAIPLFTGTLMITLIAMLVALPVGLFAAIYMAEFASPRFRNVTKPILEILAGVPTVVYGFFAALVVAPAVRGIGESIGLDVASESALAAGVVMGIMIIPFISSLSDDAIVAVPNSLREGSLAMGATKSETVVKVILPAAARDRRRLSARGEPRHRRNHDRGHGRGPRRQPHGQSAGRGDHGHGADRHPAGGRSGIRQRQDAGRLRARPDAFRRDTGAQHLRAPHIAQVLGAV